MTWQPECGRCHKRHRPELPCWKPPYSTAVSEQCYRANGRWCAECARRGTRRRATTIDHITARADGGGDEQRNLEPLCRSHNSAKGARTHAPYDDPDPVAGNGKQISERFR